MGLLEEGLPPYDSLESEKPKKKNWIYFVVVGVLVGIVAIGLVILMTQLVLIPFS